MMTERPLEAPSEAEERSVVEYDDPFGCFHVHMVAGKKII